MQQYDNVRNSSQRPSGASARAATAATARWNVTYEDLSVYNVSRANTFILYREYARGIRAVYERLWWCNSGNPVKLFVYSSYEVDSDDKSQIIRLRAYVDNYVRVIEGCTGAVAQDDIRWPMTWLSE